MPIVRIAERLISALIVLLIGISGATAQTIQPSGEKIGLDQRGDAV